MDKLIEQSLHALLAREGLSLKKATWKSSQRSSNCTWETSRRFIPSTLVRKRWLECFVLNGRRSDTARQSRNENKAEIED